MDVNNLTLPEGYQMPFSLEAEQAVLGCVLMDPNCMPQVLIYLRPEYFYLPQHKEIFSVMVSLDALGNKIDPLIILETLKNNGTYDEAAGKNYLFQLAQSVPTTSNVESYAKIVREKYFMRTLITVSQETIDNAVAQTDSADMLLDAAEQRIYDIRQGKTSTGPSKLSDIIVNQVYDTLQKLSSEGAEAFKGISTGYRDLDDVIAGLNKSDLVLIGARPAMGKTSFALNLARNVAVKAKKKILFFSLEMTKEQLAQRVLSTEARVLSTKMRTGQLDTDDWTRLGLATASLNDCELYFDEHDNRRRDESARTQTQECRLYYYRLPRTHPLRHKGRKPRAGGHRDNPKPQAHGEGSEYPSHLLRPALQRHRGQGKISPSSAVRSA